MKASACLCAVRGLPRERNSYLLERARSDQTLSDASSAPRVHVRPIYDDGGLRRISKVSWRAPHGQMCAACVFIGLMCEWRSVRGLWYPYERTYHLLPL